VNDRRQALSALCCGSHQTKQSSSSSSSLYFSTCQPVDYRSNAPPIAPA
jgi:hypothetical protein